MRRPRQGQSRPAVWTIWLSPVVITMSASFRRRQWGKSRMIGGIRPRTLRGESVAADVSPLIPPKDLAVKLRFGPLKMRNTSHVLEKVAPSAPLRFTFLTQRRKAQKRKEKRPQALQRLAAIVEKSVRGQLAVFSPASRQPEIPALRCLTLV